VWLNYFICGECFQPSFYEFCTHYAPIVDGPGGFLPKLPVDLDADLNSSDTVPTLLGINKDDGSYFTPRGKLMRLTVIAYQLFAITDECDSQGTTMLVNRDPFVARAETLNSVIGNLNSHVS
jgi:hypothetical protein